MTTRDTSKSQLVINRPTKTQFNSVTPDNYQLWFVDPEFSGGKVLQTDSSGDIAESTLDVSNVVTTNTAQDITGAKNFKSPVTIQNGSGTGTLVFGADVNADTLTANTRKLGRINAPIYTNPSVTATLLGWDTAGDDQSPVTNRNEDAVCFGGMKKITNCTSPMSITFCVNRTRNSALAENKVYALAMDANSAIFSVPPKYGSKNLVARESITDTTSTSITLSNAVAGTDYHYGTLTSLTVTANDTSDNEITIYFTAGATISVILPNTLQYIGSAPVFEANTTYVISILNNICVAGAVG